jgi:hypothetical protein
MRPLPDADLSLDLDGLDRFAGALENLTGQWNGTDNQIGDVDWLAGDAALLDALETFTRSWSNAATIMNTYSAQLSTMARACADQFRQADGDLAKQTPHGRRPIVF